jgi:hypothetical protein
MCAEKLILEGFVHGKNLQNKVAATGDKQLRVAFQEYKRFRKKVAQVKGKHKKYVDQLVGLFNEYREVAVPVFEQRRNVGQENLRSTMLGVVCPAIAKTSY